MRILIFLLVLLPFCVLSQGRTSEELLAKGSKKYTIENGIITYKISGDAAGEEIFAFDRFGWRSLKKRSMSFDLNGTEKTQDQHEISDGKLIYRIDHSDSTYRKRIDIRWSSLAAQMPPIQVSESILFSLGGTYAGDSTHLDKTCQVWTFENKSLQEMWVWQGLTLKRKSKLGDKSIITTATKIETKASIDESLFALPENYSIKE